MKPGIVVYRFHNQGADKKNKRPVMGSYSPKMPFPAQSGRGGGGKGLLRRSFSVVVADRVADSPGVRPEVALFAIAAGEQVVHVVSIPS